ncbi:MAG: deaminase [Candidatus Paceibacterota bacterium]
MAKEKTLIAYVPALHQGYINFFRKNTGKIYVIDLKLVREIPRLERDIRAMEANEIVSALKGIGFSNVSVLNKDNLDELETSKEILMPEEDVSKEFAKSYLKNKDVSYKNVFLRWNKHNSLKKDVEVSEDIKISREKFDKKIINKAKEEAKKSSDWWRQIGAIVVKDKKIILTGYNKPLPSDQVHNIFGDPRSNFDYGVSFELSKFIHAEACIIAEAAKRGISLKDTSIYVTTFPCPVCAKSIAIAGIKKVYFEEGYSLLDAESILKTFNIELIKIEKED